MPSPQDMGKDDLRNEMYSTGAEVPRIPSLDESSAEGGGEDDGSGIKWRYATQGLSFCLFVFVFCLQWSWTLEAIC